LIHGHQMAGPEDDPKFEQSSRFVGAYHLAVDLPRREQLISELLGLVEEESIDPAHGARGGHDEILLSVVDEHGETLTEEVFDPVVLGFHEVGEEVVVYVICLTVVDYVGVEGVDSGADALVAEVGLKQFLVRGEVPSYSLSMRMS
jgi:hypothetical protein